MMGVKALTTVLFVVLVGCTPAPKPLTSVEQAMAECRARIANATDTRVGVGIGVGTGGKIRGGIALGMNVDLAAKNRPHETYNECVLAKSGRTPTEPLYPTGA
jgi:hypothetical protein